MSDQNLNSKNIQQNNEQMFSIFYWILGTIWAPITVPWIIYKILNKLHNKYKQSDLNGKVVLITGASSGLGEALAHVFYSSGCRVILAARRMHELERVKNDLLASHQSIATHIPIVLQLDLSNLESLEKNISSILNSCNQIDILVNNGGISCRGDILSTNLQVYQQLMLINYFGQIALIKAVLPSMIKNKCGHIVGVSSVQGLIGIPHRSAYGASKHAQQAFYDSLRAEIAEHNINVTVVSPGYIRTDLSKNALTGSGLNYGKLDKTTANGYPPIYVAEKILKAIIEKKNEIIVADLKASVAIYLRRLLPSLFFWIMEKQAKKASE